VGAGDQLVKVGEAPERMTVAEINALLYTPPHPPEGLKRALRIEALSPGWRTSFQALLQSQSAGVTSGNAGLVPPAAANPPRPGFRSFTVSALDQECADVLSLTLRGTDGRPLPTALPGQYVVLRLPSTSGAALFRSYSLSGAPSTEHCRISVKIEPHGAAGTYLRDHVRLSDELDLSAPRGNFVLHPGERPVVLLSAGIGATPLLAMLHGLAKNRSVRPVLWIHAARDRQHHPFAAEVRGLVLALAHGRSHVRYSRPASGDKLGEDFDAPGHLSQSVLEQVGVAQDADVYICGPTPFMTEMKAALIALGAARERIRIEIFNGSEALTPGVVSAATRAPHPPEGGGGRGPLVSFSRSGVAAHWNDSAYQSILELAEACDVPVRWSCRTGVCHNCESGLVSGEVIYGPDPLEKPADGNLLVCCSRPAHDVVIDL
jgi:ferredoxin-NADP reductase